MRSVAIKQAVRLAGTVGTGWQSECAESPASFARGALMPGRAAVVDRAVIRNLNPRACLHGAGGAQSLQPIESARSEGGAYRNARTQRKCGAEDAVYSGGTGPGICAERLETRNVAEEFAVEALIRRRRSLLFRRPSASSITRERRARRR